MNDASRSAQEQILVVEDEQDILDVVAYNLEREGYVVHTALDGDSGLRRARQLVPDLVVLDVMLPGTDGIEVCRAMRRDETTADIPVVMLTAKDDETDIVLGLGVGADDYVTKPFGPKELIARVKAVLRRGRHSTPVGAAGVDSERIRRGNLIVDPLRHEVLVGGKAVRFTRTEFRLLHVLAQSPGRAFSRDQLVVRVMGDNAWITDRTIDVHVRAVRKKLGDDAALIETVRGIGYRFRDDVRAVR